MTINFNPHEIQLSTKGKEFRVSGVKVIRNSSGFTTGYIASCRYIDDGQSFYLETDKYRKVLKLTNNESFLN